MKKVLYAGSFDPLTCGHLDLIVRGAKTCETLVVGVIENPAKVPLFSVDERIRLTEMVTKNIRNAKVDSFSGLLADYVNEEGFDAVLRGLRGNTDFEYEIQMAQMNASLYEERVETLFLMTKPSYSFISSSMAKEVHSLGGNISGLVPEVVLEAMNKKIADDGGKK